MPHLLINTAPDVGATTVALLACVGVGVGVLAGAGLGANVGVAIITLAVGVEGGVQVGLEVAVWIRHPPNERGS